MERRTNEGQMEFEWNNKTGPVDATSPWMNVKSLNGFSQQHEADGFSKKRPHDVFNSPNKASGISLRDPASNSSFLFSQPPAISNPTRTNGSPKRLPPIPLPSNPAFSTPRASRFDTNYDSSEVDASSPEYNADSDATPDMGLRSGLAVVKKALTLVPEKKNPALARVNGAAGKGEILKHFSHNAEHRVKKNRSKEIRRWASGRKNSDPDTADGPRPKAPEPRGPGAVASFFSYLHAHPDLPHILSWYAQMILNSFLVCCAIYAIYCGWSTVRSDVDRKVEEAVKVLLKEMEVCKTQWNDNKCARDTRAPALEMLCNNWEICMNKDAHKLSRSQVSAHTFAEIFNSFVEPISWKAMIFTFALFCGSFYFSNLAFNQIRKQPQQQPIYVQTPQHHPPTGSQEYYSAYQSPTARFTEPDQPRGRLDMASPVRRLEF